MPVLSPQQRTTLEKAVKEARKASEIGAFNALQASAVNHAEPFAHMTPEQRTLRNALRSKARLLGDELDPKGIQQIGNLAYELAYETWHKMLFATFLEANDLLMHHSGIAVTFADCEELAKEENYTDKWDAAAAYASKMLPAIFRIDDPLMQVKLATNDKIKLEVIIDGLEKDIFTADDALGWVYQFWQSEAKAIINASGDKIDGAKLPAVTQLFTEPYMVHFLIDNTLGAWWVNRNPGVTPPIKFEYLRTLEDGSLAAGSFEGWPDTTAQITSLDPCMGSGHFIASLFPVFAALRIREEGLSKEEATDKVITENLHGLELDARCTQIAAFNLALTAWKFCGHYKELPEMNLACSGIAPKGNVEDWVKLVGKGTRFEDKERMENGMRALYNHFQLAPELGSLLDPSSIKSDTFTASFEELQPVLQKALENELDNGEQKERGVIASGIAKAGEILSKKYILQITNVPYLSRGKQDEVIRVYSENNYSIAKGNLATVFLLKMLKTCELNGIVVNVTLQDWLFQSSYKKLRQELLKNEKWSFISRIGAKGFQTPMYDFNVMLVSIQHSKPKEESLISNVDVYEGLNPSEKDIMLRTSEVQIVNQLDQLKNTDFVIKSSLSANSVELLSKHCYSSQGIGTTDNPQFLQKYWEQNIIEKGWVYFQTAATTNNLVSGYNNIFCWEGVNNKYFEHIKKLKAVNRIGGGWQAGSIAWDFKGFGVNVTSKKIITHYSGHKFDTTTGIIVVKETDKLLPIYSFLSSERFTEELLKIDQSLSVTEGTLIKVPFDLEHWQEVAADKFPNGLPKPYSDDPIQWLFHGHALKTDNTLQVATARILGYRWPAESDEEMELADEAKELIAAVKAFNHFTDDDGIFCIPSVNAEQEGGDRIREFLQAVFATEYTTKTIIELLSKEGAKATNLEDWLRNEFFIQHCRLFQNRPFIWHIWDGRKDGFSVLVNYHTLDKENLSKLIYTYLGDWIRLCDSKRNAGESGADGLLDAAKKLQEKLILILNGEAPYDIFVRWKSLEEQPIGWEPDLNDGVRLNIRPFVEAGVLRTKFNIKWGVDRGKNTPNSHWGDIRNNDIHLSLEEKRIARENKKK
ncbi:hypothetical protein [Flavobacterium sp.]|uniref:Eco57I restriction-modification methylase domain-containing protein n=1 Tax=Flavobacterium sp. TaxID=239 RepID=UPI002486CE70|nr:hypothetical protein [Flavobacterium sp.]MDI1316898.1 hypothetical protein [Flavobacterium sp.]